MIVQRHPDSVAVFGSIARGDSDGMSDRDVLIVDDNANVRSTAAKVLRARGWSPVCFTWRRLNNAIAGRGLFIQHLKLEAKILVDRGGRLRESLKRFSVRSAYDREITGSLELLGVLENIPNCRAGCYWSLDVLSVGLRTLGVATLANHGMYAFSLNRILTSLETVRVLSATDRESLIGIRQYKWRHRNSKLHRPISFNQTFKLIDLVSRRFKIGLHVKTIGAEQALEALTADEVRCPNWYLRSRVLERALLGLQPRINVGREISTAKRDLQRLVREPSQYGWQIKTEWPSLLEGVRTVQLNSDIAFAKKA